MKNHALTTAPPAVTDSADAFEQALANLADAGFDFVAVPACTHPSCASCTPRDLPYAA